MSLCELEVALMWGSLGVTRTQKATLSILVALMWESLGVTRTQKATLTILEII